MYWFSNMSIEKKPITVASSSFVAEKWQECEAT